MLRVYMELTFGYQINNALLGRARAFEYLSVQIRHQRHVNEPNVRILVLLGGGDQGFCLQWAYRLPCRSWRSCCLREVPQSRPDVIGRS